MSDPTTNVPGISGPRYIAMLACLVLLAAVLRAPGLSWGLPNELHPDWSYHHDEAFFVEWGNDLRHGYVFHRHFIYGGAFFYSTLAAANAVAEWWDEGAAVVDRIIVARSFSLLAGLLSLIVIGSAGSLLYNRPTGLLTAALLAVTPGHLLAAQRARPDELFTLFFSLNLWLAVRILRARGSLTWNIVLGGACLGFTVATRFPGGVLAAVYIAAIIMRGKQTGTSTAQQLRQLMAGLVFSVIGYSLASPQTWLHFAEFTRGLNMQWSYQSGVFYESYLRGPGWWQYGTRIFAAAIGYVLYLPALGALCYAAYVRGRAEILLLAGILPYFALLSLTAWTVVRYFTPLLPAICMLIAAAIVQLWGHLAVPMRHVVTFLCMSLWAASLTICMALAGALAQIDARDRAALWLAEHAAPGTKIGALRNYAGDVFEAPPALPAFTWRICVVSSCDIESWAPETLDLIIINAEMFRDVKRLGSQHPQSARVKLDRWYNTQTQFRRVAHFRNSPQILGWDLAAMFDVHDMRIALADIEILARVESTQAWGSKTAVTLSPRAVRK